MAGFDYESVFWSKGLTNIFGVDEVGRGALAGPVVCGCVVYDSKESRYFEKDLQKSEIRIDDSKKLSKKEREKACHWILQNSKSYGLGLADVDEINFRGIVKATNSGFRRAVKECESRGDIRINILLTDAFYIPNIRGISIPLKRLRKGVFHPKLIGLDKIVSLKQVPIIRGDSVSFSIASASIIAKVKRDNMMNSYSKLFKGFAWYKNKGYGTKNHIESIQKRGSTKLHRKLFLRKIIQTKNTL